MLFRRLPGLEDFALGVLVGWGFAFQLINAYLLVGSALGSPIAAGIFVVSLHYLLIASIKSIVRPALLTLEKL